MKSNEKQVQTSKNGGASEPAALKNERANELLQEKDKLANKQLHCEEKQRRQRLMTHKLADKKRSSTT